MQLKDRVDDLSKRVRGLEGMEKRIDDLEKRLAKLEAKPKAATKTSSAKKT
jgi:polyhydroxyalkanoate synthesis regulator phasin